MIWTAMRTERGGHELVRLRTQTGQTDTGVTRTSKSLISTDACRVSQRHETSTRPISQRLSSQQNNDNMQKPIRVRRRTTQLLHARTHGYLGTVQHRRRQHGIATAREDRGQHVVESHAEGGGLALGVCERWSLHTSNGCGRVFFWLCYGEA